MKVKNVLNDMLLSYISNIIQPSYRSEIPTEKALELQEMLLVNYEKKVIEAVKEEAHAKN